jgi:uncharacterized protein YjdB
VGEIPRISTFRTTFGSVRIVKGSRVRVPVVGYAPAGSPNGTVQVTWTSSSAKVATLTKGVRSGVTTWKAGGAATVAVRGLRVGSARITLATPGGGRLVLKVTVVPRPKATSRVAVVTKTTRLAVGKSVWLKAKASPSGATGAVATWRSTKPAVARVDAAGRVTAKAKGKTTVIVKVKGKTAKWVITVG